METHFRARGYVYSVRDQLARVVLMMPQGEIEIFWSREGLEPLGLYRKGAHFELLIEQENGLVLVSILPTPDREENEYSRAARAVDLSFLAK